MRRVRLNRDVRSPPNRTFYKSAEKPWRTIRSRFAVNRHDRRSFLINVKPKLGNSIFKLPATGVNGPAPYLQPGQVVPDNSFRHRQVAPPSEVPMGQCCGRTTRALKTHLSTRRFHPGDIHLHSYDRFRLQPLLVPKIVFGYHPLTVNGPGDSRKLFHGSHFRYIVFNGTPVTGTFSLKGGFDDQNRAE